MYANGQGKEATCGSCALAIYIEDNTVYVANAGDSKARLFQKNGSSYRAEKLNRTLNADNPKEQKRLKAEFKDADIFTCKRPNNQVCYVKGRLQPTRVNS